MESGSEWSLHERLADKSAETESETRSQRLGRLPSNWEGSEREGVTRCQ